MAVRLRKNSELRFIGRESEKFDGGRFPLTADVMCFFFHQHRVLKNSIRVSARNSVREVVEKFWSKSTVIRVQEIRGIEKIEKRYAEWQTLNKSIRRDQTEEIEKFKKKMKSLFDLAVKNAIPRMKQLVGKERDPVKRAAFEEDIRFLEDQKEERLETIAGVDGNFARVQKKKADLLKRKLEREKRLDERRSTNQPQALHTGESASFNESFEHDCAGNERQDNDFVEPKRRKDVRKVNVITSDVAQALDASKVSTNQATVILAAAAKSFGVNVEDTNINRKSVQRRRSKVRDETARKIRQDFNLDDNDVLTLHWDGKIVPTLTGKDTVDRQAIVVTGSNTSQLLGAPAIPGSSTGRAIAETVSQHVQAWNIVSQVRAACFDTTRTNTGWNNGAAAWVQRLLEKNLLWLPCRHHVLELILKAVFQAIMGSSTKGPETEEFKILQKKWKDVDKSKFSLPLGYPAILQQPRRDALISLCQKQIDVGQPRDDYLELLELAIIFLGSVPSRGLRFQPPGLIHHARWMAKAIYALEMSLFADQIDLGEELRARLLNVSFIEVSAYIEAWFSAPFPSSALRSDLQLGTNVVDFASVHPAAAVAAQTKLSDHLWYFSDELSGLAVYDEALEDDEREKIVQSIQTKVGEDDPAKRLMMSFCELRAKSVSDFSNENTKSFFRTLGLSMDFFDLPVSAWCDNESYKRGKSVVDSLSVINDHAERAVKLMQDYNRSVTRGEEAFEDLLLNVAAHRKTLPNYQKSIFCE